MSYGYQPPQQTIIVQAPDQDSNGLGIVGLVISILGIFTCGCISPIGFLISCVALLFPPRGIAFAGAIIGFLGSIWLWIGGAAIVLGFLGLGAAATEAAREAAAKAEARRLAGQAAEQVRPMDGNPLPTPVTPETPTPAPEPMPTPDPEPPAPMPVPAVPESDPTPVPAPKSDPLARKWTSKAGTTIDARFRGLTAGQVKLEKADGTVISVPFDQLSDADQAWIKAKR